MKQILHRAKHTIHTSLTEEVLKVAVVLALVASVYLFSQNIFLALVLGAIMTVLIIGWDGKIFFILGLLFLLFCPFLLASDKKYIAEKMAVNAYYMLAIGVMLQIVHHIRESIRLGHEHRKQHVAVHGHEFWTKKKLILWTVVVIFFTFLISAGIFFAFYQKLEGQLTENKKEFIDIVEKNEKQVKEILTMKAVEPVVEEPKVVELKKESIGDWESVKVFIINKTEQKGLENLVANSFKQLGCVNVYASQATSTPVFATTTVDYCPECFMVAEELSASLPVTNNVLLHQESNLANQITVQLGTDQISVKE